MLEAALSMVVASAADTARQGPELVAAYRPVEGETRTPVRAVEERDALPDGARRAETEVGEDGRVPEPLLASTAALEQRPQQRVLVVRPGLAGALDLLARRGCERTFGKLQIPVNGRMRRTDWRRWRGRCGSDGVLDERERVDKQLVHLDVRVSAVVPILDVGRGLLRERGRGVAVRRARNHGIGHASGVRVQRTKGRCCTDRAQRSATPALADEPGGARFEDDVVRERGPAEPSLTSRGALVDAIAPPASPSAGLTTSESASLISWADEAAVVGGGEDIVVL